MEIPELIKVLGLKALDKSDGHYTIFSFTTCFSVALLTPEDRVDIISLAKHKTLKEALVAAIAADPE